MNDSRVEQALKLFQLAEDAQRQADAYRTQAMAVLSGERAELALVAERLRDTCRSKGWPVTDDLRVSERTAERLLGYSEGRLTKLRKTEGGPLYEYLSGAGARAWTYYLHNLYIWGSQRGRFDKNNPL